MNRQSRFKNASANQGITTLKIEDIVPDSSQPRKTITSDKLKDLTQSLIETGQISPIVVRPRPDGKYTIVIGERRWRAAKEAGLSYIECIIRHDIDDQKALEMQLTENCQREDIPPLDQAQAFKAYLDKYRVSQRELSRRTGIPQRTISARLALLSLPMSMRAQIESGQIGPYEALKISELPSHQQQAVAEAVASGRIGGRILDKLVNQARAHPEKPIEETVNEFLSSAAILPSMVNGTDRHKDIAMPVLDKNDTLARKASEPEGEALEIGLTSVVAKADLLSELAALLTAAKEFGRENQDSCLCLDEEGICRHCQWEDEEDVPKHGGEPVKIDDRWYLKPSILYCALCPDPSLGLADVQVQLDADPLAAAKYRFECHCGAKGEIAASVRCTRCGKQTWWSWWLEQS